MATVKFFLCFVCSVLITVVALAQQISVRFSLYAPSIPDTVPIYIAGSHEALGNWSPSKAKMISSGTHRWEKTITTTTPILLQYKYTLGSWDTEAADQSGNALSNFSVRAIEDVSVYDTVRVWKKPSGQKILQGKITGEVRYHRGMKGDSVKERDIIVWLPPNYASSHQKYPVIYMQDGQNIIDPGTSAFGMDWGIDETADSLIRAGLVQPAIIVGIYNTSSRSDEYLPGEKGAAYRAFLANRIKPFVDSAYRTKPDRTNTIVGGSSAGGVLAFMMVWEYPDLFSKTICMSPAFMNPTGFKGRLFNYVSTVEQTPKRKKVFFYIDNGGKDVDSLLQPGVNLMLKALKQKGYKEGRDFLFVTDTGATHNEAAWSRRYPFALKTVLSKKRR